MDPGVGLHAAVAKRKCFSPVRIQTPAIHTVASSLHRLGPYRLNPLKENWLLIGPNVKILNLHQGSSRGDMKRTSCTRARVDSVLGVRKQLADRPHSHVCQEQTKHTCKENFNASGKQVS